MKCPSCKSTMGYLTSRGSKEIYKCNKCGAEVVKVISNNQMTLKGTYITTDSLKALDKR